MPKALGSPGRRSALICSLQGGIGRVLPIGLIERLSVSGALEACQRHPCVCESDLSKIDQNRAAAERYGGAHKFGFMGVEIDHTTTVRNISASRCDDGYR